MKKVIVKNRTGLTTSVIPHSNGKFPVFFPDMKSPEFIDKKDVVFQSDFTEEDELERENRLEMIAYFKEELAKYIDMDFKHHAKNNILQERNKNLIEFVLWIKEAFGHCINEDYFDNTLGEHIDFSLREMNIYVTKPKAHSSKPETQS